MGAQVEEHLRICHRHSRQGHTSKSTISDIDTPSDQDDHIFSTAALNNGTDMVGLISVTAVINEIRAVAVFALGHQVRGAINL